jgi:hypothetical protein
MAKQLSTHPPGHNGIQVLKGVSQTEFLDWLKEMRELDDDVQAAADRRKAKMAEIKRRIGKDEFASFQSVRKGAEMPGESRERRELARRKMMQWLNKPLGHQASLDIESEDPNVVAFNAHSLRQLDIEGETAGKAGRRRDSNPYTPGTEAAQRWDVAWLKGQSTIAASMAPEEPRRRGRPPGSRNRPRDDKPLH